ncbi:FecR family protein [uncultured Draconibacterium sp.]|uniref:FecR family protein n=1 Tax=uncultured Draconibacterium sp. TaxID=1573823 RepID=UPI0032176D18
MSDYLSVKEYFKNEEYDENLSEQMKSDWDETSSTDRSMNHILKFLHTKMGIEELNFRQKSYRLFSKIAAILILPAFITIAFLTYQSIKQNNAEVTWVEIFSPAGSRTNFQLPDGSIGWLNSGSSIKYPSQFKGERRVEISGEVWFDVVHKRNKEFKVNTPYFEIKVLGTQFNVTSYPSEKTAQVILDKGKVELTGKNGRQAITMTPNQRVVYDITKKNFVKSECDASSYCSWKDGLLIFKNVPFSEIAQRVGRKYNAEIIVHDEALNSEIFRATFEDETLDQICKLLAGVVPIEYKIHKRIIQPDGSFSKNKVEIWTKRNIN